MVALLPRPAVAAEEQAKDRLLQELIARLHQEARALERSDALDPLGFETCALLDDLLRALQRRNPEQLRAAVEAYVDGLAFFSAQQDLEPACVLPLVVDLTFSGISLVSTVTSGTDIRCLLLNLSNDIADIISIIQSYRICVIDYSPTPDENARREIVIRQVFVEIYDFITYALDIVYCNPSPGLLDYIFLIIDFLGIFPSPEDIL
jgi:hypothetical protein